MEPRVSISAVEKAHPVPLNTIQHYFAFGLNFCREHYSEQIDYYTNLTLDAVDDLLFWREYCWCVYTSGFNSKIVAASFDQLMEYLDPYQRLVEHTSIVEEQVKSINRNHRKFLALLNTAWRLYDTPWHEFCAEHLDSPDKLRKLPYIGPVTSHHLARNLGHDTVKPDLHLTRLARWFGFHTPLLMAQQLSEEFNLRIGVVDLVLFYTASEFGTKDLV